MIERGIRKERDGNMNEREISNEIEIEKQKMCTAYFNSSNGCERYK